MTFTVYSDGENVDRAFPFDIIPRPIARAEWQRTEAGLAQRVTALNHFIADIYGDRRIIRDGVFPEELLAESANFRPQCVGVRPPGDIWAHICGSDLVRGGDGARIGGAADDGVQQPRARVVVHAPPLAG